MRLLDMRTCMHADTSVQINKRTVERAGPRLHSLDHIFLFRQADNGTAWARLSESLLTSHADEGCAHYGLRSALVAWRLKPASGEQIQVENYNGCAWKYPMNAV